MNISYAFHCERAFRKHTKMPFEMYVETRAIAWYDVILIDLFKRKYWKKKLCQCMEFNADAWKPTASKIHKYVQITKTKNEKIISWIIIEMRQRVLRLNHISCLKLFVYGSYDARWRHYCCCSQLLHSKIYAN